MYARIKLPGTIEAAPVELPAALNGLAPESLADLSAALKPVPAAYKGIGFWPVTVVPPPIDPMTEMPAEGYDLAVDNVARTVTATGRKQARPAAEIAAAMAVLREQALAQAMAYGNAITWRVLDRYSEAERLTWDEQAADARALKRRETLPEAALLLRLAAAAGVTPDAYATRVLAKREEFMAIGAAAVELRAAAQAAFGNDALDTPAKLDAAVAQLRAEADALAAKLIG